MDLCEEPQDKVRYVGLPSLLFGLSSFSVFLLFVRAPMGVVDLAVWKAGKMSPSNVQINEG